MVTTPSKATTLAPAISLDWLAVLGKPSKLSIGQITIFFTNMCKSEQWRPQVNRPLCFIKDKEQQIENILRDNRLGVSKVDKNAINDDLWELYREMERANKLLDDLLEDCKWIQIQTR